MQGPHQVRKTSTKTALPRNASIESVGALYHLIESRAGAGLPIAASARLGTGVADGANAKQAAASAREN